MGGSAPAPDPRGVAMVARVLARVRLVEAFGHVSVRASDELLISSTAPLAEMRPDQVIRLPLRPGSGDEFCGGGIPLEWPLHAAIYRARPDLIAICRTHSAAAVLAGLAPAPPPLLHGLGGLAGHVGLATGFDLLTSEAAADALAAALGSADCLLVRGNGAVATGSDLAAAAVRAYFLEERCRVSLHAPVDAITPDPVEAVQRARWHEPEAVRAWEWLRAAVGGVGESEMLERGEREGAAAPEGESK